MIKKKLIIAMLILLPFILTISVKKVFAEGSQLIIVNKSENKTYFYENGKRVKTFSVATGRNKNLTPEGTFKVTVKWKCPVYYATNKKGCASDNPLGVRWIGINVGKTDGYTYGLHGTNRPDSIGTYASSGCIRMLKDDVVWLFDKVKIGTKVVIVSSPKNADTIAEEKGYKLTKKTEPASTQPFPSPTKPDSVLETKNTIATHVVKKGETLWRVSQNYKVSLSDLKKWNNLKSDSIKVGQKLIVSKSSTANSSPNTQTPTEKETTKSPAEQNKKVKKKVKVSGYLNVRSSASTSSKVIGKVKNGQILETTPFNTKWSIIYINNKKGYVSNDYIRNP